MNSRIVPLFRLLDPLAFHVACARQMKAEQALSCPVCHICHCRVVVGARALMHSRLHVTFTRRQSLSHFPEDARASCPDRTVSSIRPAALRVGSKSASPVESGGVPRAV